MADLNRPVFTFKTMRTCVELKFKYQKLFEAAKAYIDLCPCDPDIHSDQFEAWNKYQVLLKEFNNVL